MDSCAFSHLSALYSDRGSYAAYYARWAILVSVKRRKQQVRSTLKMVLVVMALCANPPVQTFAQSLDTTKAQAEMHNRISAAVNSFARRIGAGSALETYCRVELFMHTQHPADGSIPYGVNYNNIRSQRELDQVIGVREAHERNYLLLCIARAKRDLDAVEK